VNIPFLDLKAQYQNIREQVLRSIEQVLEPCESILGSNVIVFEQEMVEYLGVKHATGVGNGLMHLFSFLILWAFLHAQSTW